MQIIHFTNLLTFIHRCDKINKNMMKAKEISCPRFDHEMSFERSVLEADETNVEELLRYLKISFACLKEDNTVIASRDPMENINLGTEFEPREIRKETMIPSLWNEG